MKKVFLLLCVLVYISCGKDKQKEDFGTSKNNPTEDVSKKSLLNEGKAIFEGKGTCITCHQADKKIIGPSISEISKIYKEKNASIVSFLKEEGEALVDPSQYAIMKTNFAITKAMSDKELVALEAYILSY